MGCESHRTIDMKTRIFSHRKVEYVRLSLKTSENDSDQEGDEERFRKTRKIHFHCKFTNRIVATIIALIFIILVLLFVVVLSWHQKSFESQEMLNNLLWSCIALGSVFAHSDTSQVIPPCDSEIYCSGLLLEAAQTAYIYNDSKSFVDMKMKYEPEIILKQFEKLENDTDGKPSNEQVRLFVNDNFLPPGSEFETWIPDDWKIRPKFLDNIVDPQLRSWASDLNELWKELGRKIHLDVKMNSSRYSMIYSPNPIIIPGGRFREFYYWDTYWIIRGLLLSEMYSTVKGIILNFVDMVDQFGFVPNGGRLYYTRRSQPPFLTLMAHSYYDKTGDREFIKSILSSLEKEYNFWMKERSVMVKDSEGKNHTLNRYASKVNQPRPESYREDLQLIEELLEDESLELLSHITSACESGWDFSTRWTGSCINDSTDDLLKNMRTKEIIPVDLNSILAAVERDLAYFHKIAGEVTKENEFRNAYTCRTEAIEKILWHEHDGTYYDYLLSQKASNRQFFPSNVNPMWTKCYSSSVDIAIREKRIYDYLKSTGVLDYPGGIPASLNNSGQQWDFPNAWPPLVHMIVDGLETSEVMELKQEAYIQAQKWILSNWKAYNKTNAMFEKYDATRDDGVPGSGGEYDVQKGFGWTNGVVLILLDRYGDKLTVSPCDATSFLTTNVYEHTTSSARESTTSALSSLVVAATAVGLGSGVI